MKSIVLLLSLVLAACHAQQPHSQVLAKVGEREITQLQYELALQKLGLTNPSAEVRQEVIEKLVQRELAIQQAESLKLDAEPHIQLQIEEAKRDIVARAYAEHLTLRADKADMNTLARYYQQHPALFEKRRIYYVREINLPKAFPLLDEVKKRLQQKHSVAEIGVWLEQQKVAFNQQVVLRAAEQLPLQVLPELSQSEPEQTISFVSERGVLLYQLLASHEAPLNFEQAQPLIQSYLNKQLARRELLQTLASPSVEVHYFHRGG